MRHRHFRQSCFFLTRTASLNINSTSRIDDGLDFLPKSGRALMFPIYKGTLERRDGLKPWRSHDESTGSVARPFDCLVQDLGRSLDYLETRPDIDRTKIVYFGISGEANAPILLALEGRVKVAILASAGLYPVRALPEADAFNFVTHVKIPVLMLNGRYDDVMPVDSSQSVLFRLLGTVDKDKRFLLYEAGHTVPYRERVRREPRLAR